MTTIAGKLVKQGKRIMVELPTRNGMAKFAIPDAAKGFNDADFKEGIDATVERDAQNRIIRVTIDGFPQTSPPKSSPPQRNQVRDSQNRGSNQAQNSGRRPETYSQPRPTAVQNAPKASPQIIGEAFHNPYTFIPFPRQPGQGRAESSLLTVDETPEGADRFTGVIELAVVTRSPLMTCDPNAARSSGPGGGHKTYRALTIGDDVIVPATGVRGALRTLMTILTGGTLGYLDRQAYLIQGRDVRLGQLTGNSPDRRREKVFLGKVERVGNVNYSGTLLLGETKLIRLTDLQHLLGNLDHYRSHNSSEIWIELDGDGKLNDHSPTQSDSHAWQLRLSGKPVGGRRIEERKHEAIFKPGKATIEVPAELWAAYAGRNAHSEHSTLKRSDLVWLEPKNAQVSEIQTAEDIASLQWARWGKRGVPVRNKVPSQLHPDSWKSDGLVDEVTNLFGQVSDRSVGAEAPSFASRIVPENLVFQDSANVCQRTVLAPLAPPHPGCLAFYRESDDPDNVSFDDHDLRGYKVYRTTLETGNSAPWHYRVQSVYKQLNPLLPEQKTNKTVDLLPSGRTGILRLAVRSLTKRELALLVQACSVPWRLGGGKPLGLGLCQVNISSIINEFGESVNQELLLAGWEAEVQDIQRRVQMWQASQQPVPRLRYPRAARGNSRGGHAWFQTFGKPRMVSPENEQKRKPGLSPIYIGGELKRRAEEAGERLDPREPMLAAQTLPVFDPDDPLADLLYGYDVVGTIVDQGKNVVTDFRPIQP